MTEWNAGLYREVSTLQQAMAAEVLEALNVNGSERVLDVDVETEESPLR